MFKKLQKRLIAVGLGICLATLQTATISASATRIEDFTELFRGMDSVISQLQDFGMTLEEIEIFLNLQPKDSSFYSKKNITTTYNGNFAVMNANYPAVPQTNALTDYDGNPPKSVSDMQNRFQTVYNVAYNNFNTFRYTGPKETPEDYGNYAFYLYLSHYIDGPMRAPTANDLPEVISEQDVYVYDYFLKGSDLANYGRKISNFATTFYAIPGAKESALNLTTGLDRTVSENVSDFYNVCSTIEGGAEVAKEIAKGVIPLTVDSFSEKYDAVQNEEEFKTVTKEYVNSKLGTLIELSKYNETSVKIIIDAVLSTMLPIAAGTFSVIGLYISAIPMYTYIFTTLFEILNFLNLTQTFDSRYIRRAEIEYGF